MQSKLALPEQMIVPTMAKDAKIVGTKTPNRADSPSKFPKTRLEALGLKRVCLPLYLPRTSWSKGGKLR
jgi:hypothetical protein